MFLHNFKYAFKTLFRNKMLIFWTFAFPIILGSFFKMAFSDIEANEQLDIIDIAIVNTDEFAQNQLYTNTFQELSDTESANYLFNITYTNEKEAKQLLEDNEITGYLLMNDQLRIVVKDSGINETIFKQVVDDIQSTAIISEDITQYHVKQEITNGNPRIDYQSIYQNALNTAMTKNAKLENTTSSNLSYTMIEFYTLIAMTCLYGGILGMCSINQNLANMSSKGKRVSIAPTSKWQTLTSSALASYLIQVIGIAILFIYTIVVLKVDYGPNLLPIILLTLIGCLAGLSIGIAVACVFKTNDNIKTGIIISVTMVGCFLSGMMGITMKYIIDKNVPLLNIINPASMITDGLYSLYYYDTFTRFYFNVASLLIFSGLMICISLITLRRQKYDSI